MVPAERPTATFRFYGDLADFHPGAGPTRASPLPEATTVKDAVEARGVPHVEIGLVLADGEPAGFGHRLHGGERVAVYPQFAPGGLVPDGAIGPAGSGPARFALDGHLGTLARRLRLLGLDTWYRNEIDDADLVALAVAEDRTVLTRGVDLLKRAALERGAWIRATDPERQVLEVVDRFTLDAAIAPYTRCLGCNGSLRAATADEAAGAPAGAREDGSDFTVCSECGRLYWRGGHADSLDAIVARVRAHCTRRRAGRRD